MTEHLNRHPLTSQEIAEVFGFRERQSGYYYNACAYLGLACRKKPAGAQKGPVRIGITPAGRRLLSLSYRERQLGYVKRILEHEIFHELFGIFLSTGTIPDKKYIEKRMMAMGLCTESLAGRRASSVAGWLRWIKHLTDG